MTDGATVALKFNVCVICTCVCKRLKISTGTASDCKRDGCAFDSYSGKWNNLIFSVRKTTKSVVEFHHSTSNVLEIWRCVANPVSKLRFHSFLTTSLFVSQNFFKYKNKKNRVLNFPIFRNHIGKITSTNY